MLDAVLPLTLRDLPRFRILERSLEAHFPALRTCWVIVPDDDYRHLAAAHVGRRFIILPETEIVPELANCQASGWHKQQLVKLAMADHVRSDQYLLLDADVICARPVVLNDLIADGKAKCFRYHSRRHARWYRWAQRVLGMRRSGWVHGVTPAVFDRRAVWKLADHLNDRPPQPGPWYRLWAARARRLWSSASGVAREASNWRQLLLQSLPWTEYSLYFTFLEATGLFEQYHTHSKTSLYGNCVWAHQPLNAWNPLAHDGRRQPPFTIVQSIAGIPPEVVWQRAAPILGKAA